MHIRTIMKRMNKKYCRYDLSIPQDIVLKSFVLGKKSTDINSIATNISFSPNSEIDDIIKAFNCFLKSNIIIRMRFIGSCIKGRQYFVDYSYEDIPVIEVDESTINAKIIEQRKRINYLNSKNAKLYDAKIYVSSKRIVLSVIFNHLCFDGFSVGIYYKEINNYYDQLVNKILVFDDFINEENKKPSYIDYINESLKLRSGYRFMENVEFWKKKALEHINVDCAFKSLDLKTEIKTESIEINEDYYKRLLNYCNSHKISFTFLISSLASLVVYKMTGKKNFTFYNTTHGRYKHSYKEMCGCMQNLFLNFYCIDGNKSIDNYISDGYIEYLDCFKHSDLTLLRYIWTIKNIIFSHFNFAGPFNIIVSNISNLGISDIELPSYNNQPVAIYLIICEMANKGKIVINYKDKYIKKDDILLIRKLFLYFMDKVLSEGTTAINEL